MTDTTVTDNADQGRYEVHVDAELAGFIEYTLDGDRIDMTHTEVFEKYRGDGTAGTLASEALQDAASRDLTIVPSCPYVARRLEKHPVPGARVASA